MFSVPETRWLKESVLLGSYFQSSHTIIVWPFGPSELYLREITSQGAETHLKKKIANVGTTWAIAVCLRKANGWINIKVHLPLPGPFPTVGAPALCGVVCATAAWRQEYAPGVFCAINLAPFRHKKFKAKNVESSNNGLFIRSSTLWISVAYREPPKPAIPWMTGIPAASECSTLAEEADTKFEKF